MSTNQAEKLDSAELLAYRRKLLSAAEFYFSKDIICFPTNGKKPLPGFTYEKYHNWKITFKEFEDLINSHQEIASGIAMVGGFSSYFKAYLNCLDIDDLQAYKKIINSKIGHYFSTTRVQTYRGYHHYMLTDYELGKKDLFFEGQKVGEWRGSGVYWIAPPSQFFWEDKKGNLQFYQYSVCDPRYPLVKIRKKEIEEIFEFFLVRGTQVRPRPTIRQDHARGAFRAEFTRESEKVAIERFFDLLGYAKLCPFHPERHQSFDFYLLPDGNWRCHCFHEGIDLSLGELFWWYIRAPKSKARVRHTLGSLKEAFYTMLNKRVGDLIGHGEELTAFLESEPVQQLIQAKRKANREGYRKGFIFLFGLMLQKSSSERFLLPVDLLSEIIGVSYKECWNFLRQLEGKGFIERLHKRRANRSINKVNVYRKGSWFNTFLDICKR